MGARHIVIAGTAVLSLTLACGGSRPATGAASGEPTHLSVRNMNWADVTIFAVRGTKRSRVGDVPALGTRTLTIPRSAMPDGTVRLLVDPLGSARRFLTEQITVSPGQQLELVVMPNLTMSTLAVHFSPQ